MRLKKGSKVEVFHSTKSLPDGFWRPGQILCGNGHTYSVQYDNETKNIQKVPRKSIRPCPPLKEKLIDWKIGDLVEVLIHGSWRQAKVTGVAFGNNFIFVMLIDQSREFAVKRDNVRRRHIWQNNKWIIRDNVRQRHIWQNNKWIIVKKDAEGIKKMKKRKLDDFNYKGDVKRPRLEFDKVINMKDSCENESMVSSSGSCSTSGRPRNYTSFSWANDDAMSSCEPIKEKKIHFGKEMRDGELLSKGEMRKLELDAYYATLSAFYKKGSISWEQEGILSNLRLYLTISFDEHRSVLRSLGPRELARS